MTNIIDIYFDSVGSTATAPSKLWQWSKGQIVRINGLDLPTVYQVHFSNNPTLGTAEPVAVSGNMVSIPDIYLTTGEPVYLFIWLSDETSAETIRKGTIYVAKRSQPSGAYDPTAEQQTIIDGLIGATNTAVDTAEGYANSAQTYSGNAATSATEALNAKDAAQGYAEQANQTAQGVEILVNRAEDAADDAETAKQDVEQLKQAVEGLADDAESAKTDAETARGEAQGFAQTASTKASEAVQSASQASQSATTATAQAQTATAKATEASQSAETATTKASEASASATTASTKASEASTSASTATTAKNDAVTAKNAAVAAKTGAETARNGAEAAAQSVSQSAAQIATNTSDITDLKADLNILATITKPESLDIREYPYQQGYLAANGVFTPTTGTNAQKTTNAITLAPGDYAVSFEGEYLYNGVVTPVYYVRAIAVYNANDECTSYQQTVNLNSFTIGENDVYVRINVQYTSVTTYAITSTNEETTASIKPDVIIPTDSTLTENKPANAKAVGDALKNVKIDNFYMPYRRPLIAFNFDGEYNRNANFKALFDQHSKKCGYALPYSTNFPYTTKETYLTWQNEGFEIMAHSAVAVGTQSSATDDEIRQIVKDAYTTLTGYGFNIHGFVAYQGNAKPVAVDQAQRMYDYGMTVTNHAGNLSGDLARANTYFAQDPPYKLWRYSMQASTLDQMKAAVDECYNTYGLVLFYGHANASALNNMTIENIDALLTYIESKGIPIMTPYEAIKDFYTVRPQDFITN